jgi:tetratricopeptide (TPR) repeat protein
MLTRHHTDRHLNTELPSSRILSAAPLPSDPTPDRCAIRHPNLVKPSPRLLPGVLRGCGAWLLCPILLAVTACTLFSRAPRVLLVGIDGLDPDIVSRLVGEAKLPTFARLIASGAHGRLRSFEPLLSPIVWTTIATSRKPQDHGILDFVEFDAAGRVVPVSSARRRVPALWDIARQYGRRSGFIGWYASYPAATVDGFTVSDRLAFHQVRSSRAAAGATFPDRLADDLRQRVGEPSPDLAATRARFAAGSSSGSEDGEARLAQLARIHATTEFYRRALPYLQRTYHPELLGVYFELVDACEHLFMEDAPPRRPGLSDEDFNAFSQTVDRCYEYQDAVLADVMTVAGAGTDTLVVSDHGFKSGDQRPETSGRADTGLAPLWHRLYGTIIVSGRDVRAGDISGATILDIAPTVAALLDVPVARDLEGEALRRVFSPGRVTPRAVAHYAAIAPAGHAETPGSAPSTPSVDDDDRISQLRALGYLGSAASRAPHDDSGRTAASYLNEGWARTNDGDAEGALRAFATVQQMDPSNVNARVFAARVLMEQGDLAAARPLLESASRLDPRNVSVRLQRAGWAIAAGDRRAAAAELDAAERLDRRLPMLYMLRARIADQDGKPAEALDAVHTAERFADRDTLLADLVVFESDLLRRLGRPGDADTAVARAATMMPRSRVDSGRGDLALAHGDSALAIDLFQRAIAGSPRDAGLERKLGEAFALADRAPEAEAAFRRGLSKARDEPTRETVYGDLALLQQQGGREADVVLTLREGVRTVPQSARLWGMLGAAFGRQARLGDAMAAYEESVRLRPTALACKTLAALVFEERHDRQRAVGLWTQSLGLDPAQEDVRAFLRRFGPSADAKY